MNDEIKKAIITSKIIPDELADDNFIELLPNFKDHLMLSTEIIRNLIVLMKQGMRYDEAMKELGYDHYKNNNIEKSDLLVPVNRNNNITNQRVIRSLTQARKVMNAIIKKYGMPKIINIETARELAKTREERREIEQRNVENKAYNEKIKQWILEQTDIFQSIDKISGNDVLKYKLWKEQGECCGYSQKKISLEELFGNNLVQIDHILPYSRTFNDNYLNKTLVLTKENQDKGDRTPYEWFGNTPKWSNYESFINHLNISQNKKDNYLLKKLDFDMEREMREQNLNDTKYISRELASLIKAYLNVEKVNVYQGAMTDKLRARWGLNRLTHSYVSKNYRMPSNIKVDAKKDRDNHLHHALDALVIAAITPSLQQKITYYEKFSRYVDGKLKSALANEEDTVLKFYNDRTGEIDTIGLKEYLKNEISQNHIYFSKHNVAKLQFPLPYENFAEEAKLRVYEQDEEVLKWNLASFPTYSKKELEHIHPLTPSFAKPKISGKMHEETYYGIKTIEDKLKEETKTFKTIRKPLTSIKRKDLENIPDKLTGSKDIYNAITTWLGDCEDGAQALKKHNGQYPINPNDKENKEIKRIKIYLEYKNTGHMIKNSNVEKGGIYRINIYKSKNKEDKKLYFSALDIFDIKKIENVNKGKKQNFPVKLEYAQGKNFMILSYDEIVENYDLYMTLNKNDLIEVIKDTDEIAIGYVVGFSGGKLEIKSKIGDGYDLIGEDKIFKSQISRYTTTVSTIKSIRKLTIDILGNINGL